MPACASKASSSGADSELSGSQLPKPVWATSRRRNAPRARRGLSRRRTRSMVPEMRQFLGHLRAGRQREAPNAPVMLVRECQEAMDPAACRRCRRPGRKRTRATAFTPANTTTATGASSPPSTTPRPTKAKTRTAWLSRWMPSPPPWRRPKTCDTRCLLKTGILTPLQIHVVSVNQHLQAQYLLAG